MKVIKKGGQKYSINANRIAGNYEIRTFTGNQRKGSPVEVHSQNIGRSPNRNLEQGIMESALGEMLYLDQNEGNYIRGQNMSPLNDSNNIIIRSPKEINKNDYGSGGIINMSHRINFSKNPKFQQVNYEENRERERSPKTINIGESPQEMEYNIKTFNKRVNNANMNSPLNNNLGDKSYNMMLNDTGNIFLDQPMQQAYNQPNDILNSSTGMTGIKGINDQRSFEQNNREIQYGMNPRDLQEPIPGVLRKMSPKGNVEGDSDSNSEKNENVNQIRDLKTQLDRNMNVMYKNEDGIGIGDKNMQNRGDLENLEIMAKSREFQDNITGDEVKKLIKYYVKTYDPLKGEDGNLISNCQTIILSNHDQLFQDRYKVLQKMNKLSSILLAKNRNGSPDSSSLNKSFGEDRKKLDAGTLNNTTIFEGKRPKRNIRRNKFLYVSLAMLSAKGPNTEDRTILRKMRLDKGGVVDLAQESLQKKTKFKIKKARAGGRGITSINPKYREKAAKIVQSWWRERKEKYRRILEQIIKIQSVWRGKFTRKYIYDVIYISYLQEKFLSIMRNVLVNHVRPYVFDELFSKNKLIKDTLRNLLLQYDDRFTLLRLKPYFLKWKNNSSILSNRILKSRELFSKKEQKENKLSILKKYFDKWVLMSNLYKYIGKAKNADEKRQKFFGMINIVNGLSSLSKRQIFKNTKEPICTYLKDLLKQKLLIKIIKKICKKCLQLKIKNYISNWRIAATKKKLDDFKKQVFLKIINHMDSRLDKIKIKYYLDKWRKNIPSSKTIFDLQEGGNLLKKFALKNTIKDLLDAFSKKCNGNNNQEILLKVLKIKKISLKDKLKNYFDEWKNKTLRLDDKDKRNELYRTILKNIINKINNRILHKRFNQWHIKPISDPKEEMKKVNNFTNKLNGIFRKNFYDTYKSFLDKLDKTRDEHSLKNAANKLFKICNNKRRVILRYYLFKWRSQIKNDELNELHRQLLKYIITTLNRKNNRNELGKYFTRWRLFVGENKNYDNLGKLKQVLKGGDLLDNIYKRRIRDLINRLYKKLGKDYRPKVLGRLIKDLDKPHSSVRECFDKWKRIIEDNKTNQNISKFKAKIIHINIDSIRKRNNRDKLIKAFYHWRTMSQRPNNYYPKINNFLNSLKIYAVKKASREPFNKIKLSRNPSRHLLKIIKNKDNQQKRLLNEKLRNLLGRWRSTSSHSSVHNLKAKILYNLKIYFDESQKKKLLSKYFTKWRLNLRKKGLDFNFTKGLDKISELFKAPVRRKIYDAFINKIKNNKKENATKDLIKALDNYKNNLLKNLLLDWWKKVLKSDPHKSAKIKTKIIKIIKYSEMETRLKAFRKWAKFAQILKLKDKDLYNAKKIMSGVLRHNDKMNLYKAFNRWRNKIHNLKEQYLKALLIKQIKSSQKVKEKLSNEAKLRAALLKWRKNLISINYLDTIKQIRRGCKLFKLGLKKMHEREILDNIKELGKENKKKSILKNIIKKIIPELYKQKVKNAFDNWKSKVLDTQKMKDKLKNLLDDYIYTDKVHNGLFQKPKEDIIHLFKVYDDKRKNSQQKIRKFVKGILNIPDQMRKMVIHKYLDSIVKKKNDHLNYIKKIQFIRFYRQTQKVRVDECVRKIQKFFRKKLRKKFDKNNLINVGLDKLNSFVKKKCFNKIKNSSKTNYTTIILKKCLYRKGNNNLHLLRDKFNAWRNKIPLFQKEEAAIKIQNNYRKYNANQNLKELKLRKLLLIKIHENKENKNKIKLMSALIDWLHRALKKKNDEGAKKIQEIYRKRLEMKKKNNANEKLKNIFKKYVKHKLSNIMEKVSRILGGKGLIVYKTLQDIIYKNPFNILLNNLKIIGKENVLKKIQPKIHDRLKKYYLPKALKKWKENTYDQTIKHTILLQKFLRDQYNKKMKKDKERRELLLLQFINKKIKNNSYKLKLPFNMWYKKVKLQKMNEKATKIQNNFRKSLASKKAKDLKTGDKYLKLIKNLKKKSLIDIIKKIKDNKENKNNRKKKLLSILSKKIIFNDKANLENCFNKWKKINQITKDSATQIANAFRSYKARKERNRLNKINSLIKKHFLKHEKKDNDIKRTKLRKWNNKSKLIKINEKVRAIQKFMKPKLAKIRNDKFKRFFNDNVLKKIYRLMLLSGKINKLQNALKKQSQKLLLNNLKANKKDKNRNNILRKVITKTNEKKKNILLKKYIEKWKEQNNKIKEKTNGSVLKIQKAYKGYKARKKKNRLLIRKKIILDLIKKKDNIINNNLYITLRKWIYIVRTLTCNDNAKIIQKNWRKFLVKKRKDEELSKKLRINNGLEKLINIKFGGKYAIDKINSEKNRNIFNKFNEMLKKKRLNNLKDSFNKIKKEGFDNTLKKALKIPDSLKRRILKKIIINWKDKTDKLAKKRSVEKIAKNWKIYLNNKKQKNKKELLKKILSNIILKKSNILKIVFKKWNDIAKSLQINYAKARLAKFFRNKFKIANARKNWKDLYNKIKLKNRNGNLFQIIKKINQIIHLNKFKKSIVKLARKNLFDKIKNDKKKTTIYLKYSKLIPKINEKNNNDILKNYFLKWKKNINKINERENKLNKALNTLSKRKNINSINDINTIMILKKLFHDIPLIRAKSFINKIKDNANKKTKYNKLSEDIINSKDYLDNQKKKKFLNKIYKLYTYNKINDLITACKNFDDKLKKTLGKELLYKLSEIKSKFATYNYNNNLESTNKAKVTKLKFKNKMEINNKILSDQNAPMKKVLPSLIKYLDRLIKRRKKDAFEKVKSELISINFNKLLKNFSNKITEPSKKEFAQKFKREAKYSETRPIYQSKLYKLFRKKYIKTIKTLLIKPSRLYRLFYIINMTQMHTNIASQRYYREIVRKWRFISFTKKMARKKLELMYKNLHASYLQMADEIFGDDKINPSVFKEFERFGTNVGMFTGQEPEIDEELNKKYYTNVDKKYVFTTKASGIISENQDIKMEEFIEQMKEDEKIKPEQEIKHAKTQTPKSIKEKFDSIKKSGLSSKYFENK